MRTPLAARAPMARGLPPRAGDFASRLVVGTLYVLLSVNLLGDFLRTRHLTGLMLLVSESAIVILTIVRRRTDAVDRSVTALAVTGLSIAGPPLLRTGLEAGLLPDPITAALSAAGLVVAIAGKVTLGRSFGIVPANRGVVARGPYALVRHPIYAGYVITHVAFALAHPSAWNVIVIATADASLVARAAIEERLLAGDAAYRAYSQRVSWHLVPGVF